MVKLEEVLSDISPYEPGDVLMFIGGTEKLIVVGGGHYHYGVWKMIRVYNMDIHHTIDLEKNTVDWLYVKVGTWDFETEKEIEDDQ